MDSYLCIVAQMLQQLPEFVVEVGDGFVVQAVVAQQRKEYQREPILFVEVDNIVECVVWVGWGGWE